MENGIGPPLTGTEQDVLEMITEAADRGEGCPMNIDIEVALGYDSCSMGSWLISQLERKGVIVVRRYQRFREVQIVATGQWTARAPSMHSERVHVPRGMRRIAGTPVETDGLTYRIGKPKERR